MSKKVDNKIPASQVSLSKNQLNICIKIFDAINNEIDLNEVVEDLTFIDKCESLIICRKFEEAKKVLENGK